MSKHSLTIGRIVHYIMPNGIPRPAIVVRVWKGEMVNLQVFTDGANDPSGAPGSNLGSKTENVTWATSVRHEPPTAASPLTPYTWHWPDEHAAALAEGAIAEGMRGA